MGFNATDRNRAPRGQREAFTFGQRAYLAGLGTSECPYSEREPVERDDWYAGWLYADRKDPLLDDDEREPDNR